MEQILENDHFWRLHTISHFWILYVTVHTFVKLQKDQNYVWNWNFHIQKLNFEIGLA